MMACLVVVSSLTRKRLLILSVTESYCKKMEHYGVRGISFDWFKLYLTDRKQYVFVNGYTCDKI